jgi:predicted kinase
VRCSDTTLYLAGLQVNILDIVSVAVDGAPTDPARLPRLSRHATLKLQTRFGTTTVNADPGALHGRKARTASDAGSDPVLAALALANFARHPRRSASRAYARRLAPSALRSAREDDLVTLVSTFPAAFDAWRDLAPAQLAVRIVRSGRLAAAALDAGLFSAAAGCASIPERSRTLDISGRDAVFSQEILRGGRPEPKSYAERATLAAAYPDVAAQMISDPHPLVRAAAYQRAPHEALLSALTADVSDAARRAAASVLAARLGLAVTTEGPIRGRAASGRAERPEVLFVDVDSTLIEGENLRDASSVAALHAAQAAGVVVVLVTGRTLERLTPLDLGVEFAVADGELVDVTGMRALGRFSDKGDAVRGVCAMLGTTRCAAVGDGAIDAPMFEQVREFGGRAGVLASGQNEALAAATDLVGPFGSGGAGRFVQRLLSGEVVPAVPPIRVPVSRPTNYSSWMVAAGTFDRLLSEHGVPEGWKAAHGHVTLDYPQPSQEEPLRKPDPDARLEAYALVRSPSTLSLAVRATLAGGTVIDSQLPGTPLHLTLATAPSSRGGHVPPVAAGRAVAAALAEGDHDGVSIEVLPDPVFLDALSAPAGSASDRLPLRVEEAAIRSGASDAIAAGVAFRGVGEAAADHLAADRPVEAALRAQAPLSSGLVVLSGLPASGKTTLAHKAVQLGAVAVSLDAARGELNGDEASQERLADVLAVSHARLAMELSLGRVVVSDATNVERRVLDHHLELARVAGVPAVSVALGASEQTSLERDRARHEAGHRSVGGGTGGPYSDAAAARIVGRLASRLDTTASGSGVAAGFDASLTPDELLAALGG